MIGTTILTIKVIAAWVGTWIVPFSKVAAIGMAAGAAVGWGLDKGLLESGQDIRTQDGPTPLCENAECGAHARVVESIEVWKGVGRKIKDLVTPKDR